MSLFKKEKIEQPKVRKKERNDVINLIKDFWGVIVNNKFLSLLLVASFVIALVFRYTIKDPFVVLLIVLFLLVYTIPIILRFSMKFSLIFSHYKVISCLARLRKHKKGDKDLNKSVTEFEIGLNSLREDLKRNVSASRFLITTSGYKKDRINKEIDVFFDTVTEILLSFSLSGIGFTPQEDFYIWVDEMSQQSAEYDYEPPDDYEIESINFRTMGIFFNYLYKVITVYSKKLSINLVAIDRLFTAWNEVLFKHYKNLYQQYYDGVTQYYDAVRKNEEVRSARSFEIKKIIIGGIFVTIIAIILKDYILPYLPWIFK